MACTAVSIPTSPVAIAKKDILKEQNGMRRSHSSKDLGKRPGIQRSHSDNHLCYSINRVRAMSTQPKLKTSHSAGILPFQISSFIFPNSLRSLLFDLETSKDINIVEKDTDTDVNSEENDEEEIEIKRANWVESLLEIQRRWKNRQPEERIDSHEVCHEDENSDCDRDRDEGGCMVAYDSGEESEERHDRESFSRLLAPVPWSDTKLFSQLAFLCNMAYVIQEIKAEDLRRYYGLQFLTSSLQKKAEAAKPKADDQDSTEVPIVKPEATESSSQQATESKQIRPLRSSVAYEIAASAASYIQSRAKGLLSLGSESLPEGNDADSYVQGNQSNVENKNPPRVYKSVVAAHAAASTMTTVVAAGEKEKQEAARDLRSLHSSPCDWFICDDTSTYTRFFVIQGSDSLASWQANLFFEPTKFEKTDVIVHRGIYEAAKGIYEQFIPEILDHLKTHGDRAKFQFTGHSLGGSLSLLVNLMLLTRKVVNPSALRPVVTFGSPFVFCGGEKILDDLGLDENHVQCVIMHRDIVPRAFSCNYPNHVALVLKRLNSSFHSHPCLINNKLLYSPLGRLFILQPNEKSSPSHPLLPPGNALYSLDKSRCGYSTGALRAFLNCPHPLETLSDPTAYGSDGSILRDHDSSNYLKAVNGVLRQNTRMVVRKVRKQRNMLWPLLTSPSPRSWSHDRCFESSTSAPKEEIMTGV